MGKDEHPHFQRLNWNTIGEGLTLHVSVPVLDSTEQLTPQQGEASACTAADTGFYSSAGRGHQDVAGSRTIYSRRSTSV